VCQQIHSLRLADDSAPHRSERQSYLRLLLACQCLAVTSNKIPNAITAARHFSHSVESSIAACDGQYQAAPGISEPRTLREMIEIRVLGTQGCMVLPCERCDPNVIDWNRCTLLLELENCQAATTIGRSSFARSAAVNVPETQRHVGTICILHIAYKLRSQFA
jgi:hypothetical protein